jgi:signal transduction histidine kinase
LRIRQALANLVDNAIRHGDGDIDLRARAAPDGIEIDVTDQGEGFGPDLAVRAFERFTRASESRSGDGAGLGLAIVLAIAAGHGGSAAIVEGPRRTTVRLTLPAGPSAQATAPAPADANAAARSQVPLI